MEFKDITISWLGHDSFRLDFNGKIIYIDPFNVGQRPKGDLILVTHGHFDHCSIKDLAALTKQETIIVTTPDTTSKLAGKVDGGLTRLVVPGKSYDMGWCRVEAVPAYNVGKDFHPKDNQWVGYILTLGQTRIYHAGDTDLIPEMSTIRCDIAMLPVSGTYVMTAQEAAKAAAAIKPALAIPMHYGGDVIGTQADAQKFKELCQVPVQILPKS